MTEGSEPPQPFPRPSTSGPPAAPHLSSRGPLLILFCSCSPRLGKPSLCPAGWGRSHPDKEFDSSNPVVRQAGGREGTGSGLGGGLPLPGLTVGRRGSRDHPPQRPPLARGAMPSLAGQGDPGDRDRDRDPEIQRVFRQHLSTGDPKTVKPRKPQMPRHSGTQGWRQRQRYRKCHRPDTQRQMQSLEKNRETDGQTFCGPLRCQSSEGAKNEDSFNSGLAGAKPEEPSALGST